jgi:hypothetical protein
MRTAEVTEIAATIAEGIVSRGFFALTDQQRIDLICGSGTLHNLESPDVKEKIKRFARANGWDVTSDRLGFIFGPKRSRTAAKPKSITSSHGVRGISGSAPALPIRDEGI